MAAISAREAEDLAEHFLDACNDALAGDGIPLDDLLAPGAILAVVTGGVEPLAGPEGLVERLADEAWRGALLVYDAAVDDGEVVVGVARADDPASRVAEVRLEPDEGRIARVEWLE